MLSRVKYVWMGKQLSTAAIVIFRSREEHLSQKPSNPETPSASCLTGLKKEVILYEEELRFEHKIYENVF